MSKRWDRALLKTIQQILMSEWDPIGIKGYIKGDDEYDGYAMQVYSQLAAGASADEIAGYLKECDVQHRDKAAIPPVAEHLVAAWRERGKA